MTTRPGSRTFFAVAAFALIGATQPNGAEIKARQQHIKQISSAFKSVPNEISSGADDLNAVYAKTCDNPARSHDLPSALPSRD